MPSSAAAPTSGGEALPYYATMRLDVRYIGKAKQGEEVVAAKTRVKVVKNKLSPPFTEAEFEIAFGRGVVVEGEALDIALAEGLVKKSGAHFSYAEDDRLGDRSGVKIAQGRQRVIDAWREDREGMELVARLALEAQA